MDQERFDSLLLDELYGELDEETSAAMRSYAASNPEAAAKLSALEATRKAARHAIEEPPADLEARILARARAAEADARPRRNVTALVSRAGRWAMRPQNAMAAVFLVMIGSSVLLMRGRRSGEPATSSLTVTEQGTPVESAAAPEAEGPLDPKSVAMAHGTEQKRRAATASPSSAPAADEEGSGDPGEAPAAAAAPAARARASEDVTGGVRLEDKAGPFDMKEKDEAYGSGRNWAPSPTNAGALAGAAKPVAAAPAKKGAPAPDDGFATPPPAAAPAPGGLGAGSVAGGGGAQPTTEGKVAATKRPAPEFEQAMAAYNTKDFATATKFFDAAAASGDATAALWAARSVSAAAGCSAAVGRYDAVSARSFGTQAGYDATLEAGRCYKAMGNTDAARTRFIRLLTVPSHEPRAQAELASLAAPKKMSAEPAATQKAAPAGTKQKAAPPSKKDRK